MAPPRPSPDLPLPQRLLALAQTLQFAWFIGHVFLLASVSRFALAAVTFRWNSKLAHFNYRLAFTSAAVTYGIVVYKAYRARSRASPARQPNWLLALLTDDNVQYLTVAMVWLFSRQVSVAVVPFAIYSVFHVASYSRATFLPVVFPADPRSDGDAAGKPPQSSLPLAEALGRFVKQYYDASMGIVAASELLIWIRLMLSLLTFSRGAIFLFVVYTAFLRARYAQSPFVQGQVRQLTARMDATIANQGTPPVVRQTWGTIKKVVGQVVDATDFSGHFAPANQPRSRKAQ